MPGNDGRSSQGGLPTKIKCSVCQTTKNSLQDFSSAALEQYRAFARKQNRAAQLTGRTNAENDVKSSVRCKDCTGEQSRKLTCQLCLLKLDLKWFAKAQRKNPDRARCLECMRATEFVLPTSADDATTEEGIVGLEYEDDDDEDNAPHDVRSTKIENYFIKDSGGQYFSKFHDDASSVSNPWESRTASEAGHSTSRSKQFRDGETTSLKLASLQTRARGMNIEEDNGTTTSSLAYRRRATQSDSSDADSDGSAETIRGNIKTSDETTGKGKAVLRPDLSFSGASQPSRSENSANSSMNADSSDEEDEDYQFTRLAGDEHVVAIYETRDLSTKSTENQDPTNISASSVSGSKQFAASESASNPFASGLVSGKSGSTSLMTESLDQEMLDVDAQHRASRIAASGFKTKLNNYAKSKNFGRVRPTNMLAADIKNSLVFRKNYVDAAVCRRDPEELSSDED